MTVIDQSVLAKIARLDLKAKYIVEGFIAGMHRSPFKGFSVEFAQHRGYVPGDDLKHLDWRVYGKSEKYYIKQYEAETNLVCNVLLDASTSMNYRGAKAFAGLSKLDYAKLVAAALAQLVISQSDAAGVTMFADTVMQTIAPSTRKAHMLRICTELQALKPRPKTGIGEVLQTCADRLTRRGIVMLISDCFDQPDAIRDGLRRLRHRGHEVVVLHVLDHDELDFPFEGMVQFKGLESDRRLLCHPRSVKEAYLKELHAYLTGLQAVCRTSGVDYVQLNTSQPVDIALSAYLAKREHAAVGGGVRGGGR